MSKINWEIQATRYKKEVATIQGEYDLLQDSYNKLKKLQTSLVKTTERSIADTEAANLLSKQLTEQGKSLSLQKDSIQQLADLQKEKIQSLHDSAQKSKEEKNALGKKIQELDVKIKKQAKGSFWPWSK